MSCLGPPSLDVCLSLTVTSWLLAAETFDINIAVPPTEVIVHK